MTAPWESIAREFGCPHRTEIFEPTFVKPMAEEIANLRRYKEDADRSLSLMGITIEDQNELIKEDKAEIARLRKDNAVKKCYSCGEEFLKGEGAKLYDELNSAKAEIERLRSLHVRDMEVKTEWEGWIKDLQEKLALSKSNEAMLRAALEKINSQPDFMYAPDCAEDRHKECWRIAHEVLSQSPTSALEVIREAMRALERISNEGAASRALEALKDQFGGCE